jgi:magnesium-transporting ATPase (P-type)
MRVIAFAYKETSINNLSMKNLGKDLIFLGVAGIIDPPREEVQLAIKECFQAGIKVKMVTGDHRETAVAIGNLVGIVSEQVLTGDKIDAMDDNAFADLVNNVDIYARTTPEHKLRLIQALRKHHHIIAMTGDGVNDAPALRHADIGIAMGRKGTDISKEAAEIVLTDDNFSSITAAVKEARTVYENLKKVILFILPNDAAEGFSVFLAILFGYTLPITPLQILWVNLVTAVTLGLALAFEPTEKNIMFHPPRVSNEPLFSKFLLWRIIFVSILFASSMFALFIFEINLGKNIELTRTMVVNLLVMAEIFYLLNCRKIYDSVLNKEGLFSSKPILISIALVITLQLCFTYFPFMQHIFKTVSMNLNEWGLILAITLTLFLIIEFEKMIMSKFKLRH